MKESQRERLRSKELWTMMEWVVWLCPLCESESESESERAWWFDSIKRITMDVWFAYIILDRSITIIVILY